MSLGNRSARGGTSPLSFSRSVKPLSFSASALLLLALSLFSVSGVSSEVDHNSLLTQPEVLSSWNPHVPCTPNLTTFEQIINNTTPLNNGGILANSNWATYDFGYVDGNSNNAYDLNETVVWDMNQNGIADRQNGTNDQSYAGGGQGGDRVVTSYPPPLVPTNITGTALKRDPRIRYIDGTVAAYYNATNGNYDLGKPALGETIVFDSNNNERVDSGDTVINGTTRPPTPAEIGQPLTTATMGGTWNKRNLSPACTVTNKSGQIVSTFVEIHGVYPVSDPVPWIYQNGGGNYTRGDCDTKYNGVNHQGAKYPNRTNPNGLCDSTGNWQTFGIGGTCSSSVQTACSHRLHFEIDRDWMAEGWCGPGTTCDNSTLTSYMRSGSSGGVISLDIQGFVYWDPTETDKAAHQFSGWEIHPFTAWRLTPLDVAVTCAGMTAGKPVTCNASATGGVPPYSFAWSSNGSPATGASPSYTTTLAAKGTLSVNGTVTDSMGAHSSQTVWVTITSQPILVSVTCEPASSGKPVACTASAIGGAPPYTFTWNSKGTPTTGTGSTYTTTFASKGSQTVNATAKDTNNVSKLGQATISVAAQPITTTVTCGTAATGNPVTSSASATGGTSPYTFSWSAPGGTPSSGSGPSFTTMYAVKGTHTITATAADSNAVQKAGTASVVVAAQPITTTVTCGTATAGKPVICTASATGGTPPYTFAWFAIGGSPASGSGSSFTTTYATRGTFVLNATATDANNVKKSQTVNVVVAAQPILVTLTCGTATAGKPVTCSASVIGGTSPYTFSWSAPGGDPSTGTGGSFTTMYAAGGNYSVTLVVADVDSVSKTALEPISVVASPSPSAWTVWAIIAVGSAALLVVLALGYRTFTRKRPSEEMTNSASHLYKGKVPKCQSHRQTSPS